MSVRGITTAGGSSSLVGCLRPLALGALALVLLCPARAAADHEVRFVGVHPDLSRRIDARVLRCDPYAQSERLLVARVEVTAPRHTALVIGAFACGAVVPGTDFVLFTNTAKGPRHISAGLRGIYEAVFPWDPVHRECRCWARLASISTSSPRISAASALPAVASPPERTAPARRPRAEPALWNEIVVRDVLARTEPGASEGSESAAWIRAGARLGVIALSGGWKKVKSRGGKLLGWIPADAATAQVDDSQRMARLLLAVAPGDPDREWVPADSPGLCVQLSREDLTPLVFAMRPERSRAYVHGIWHLLPEAAQRTFYQWAHQCYGVREIHEASTGARLLGYEGQAERNSAAES